MKRILSLIISILILLSSFASVIGIGVLAAEDDIMTADDMTQALINSTAYTQNGDVLNGNDSKAGKYAKFTNEQDFILNFDVKFDTVTTSNGTLQLRLRWKDGTGHSIGYRVYFTKTKLTLEKFNDDNWKSTVLKSAEHDFTQNTSVRLVANGTNIWVALNGVKKFEITDAVNVDGGSLAFYGVAGSAVSEISVKSLKKYSETAANDGLILDPVKPTGDIKTAAEITQSLIDRSVYKQNGDVLNDFGAANKFSDLTTEQNFIFNFTVKLDSASSGSLQVRLRAKDASNHSVGYRVNIGKSKITLEKFNDNNWQSTVLKSAEYNFTDTVKVRIVANEGNIWIALNGVKVIEITDAITVENGYLKFYSVGGNGNNEVVINSLKYYSETDANDGLILEPIIPTGDIKTVNEIHTALINSGAYAQNGEILNNTDAEHKNATLTTEQNFIFDFNVKLDTAMESGNNLQVRMRTKDATGHSEGYRVHIYKNKLSFHKFNDNNWQSTEIGMIPYDFTKTVAVRLVANGSNIWIALDGVKLFEITDAVTVENGVLSFYGITGTLLTGEVKAVALKYYDETTANDGITAGGGSGDGDSSSTITGDIKSADEIITALVNNGIYTKNGSLLNDKAADNKFSDLTAEQNFIFDFSVKLDSESAGVLQVRLRAKDATNHSVGYRVNISKSKITLEKFNDDNWKSTVLKSADYDFTNTVKVRIVANGSNIWIALDDIKLIEITDAVTVENGLLKFYSIGGNGKNEVGIISLKYFDKQTAEKGITLPEETDVVVSTPVLYNKLAGSGWKKQDGGLASADPVNYGTYLAEINDFVLDFDIRIAPSELGELQVRIRHDYISGLCNLGYRIGITNNKLTVAKYNDDNYNFTTIKSQDVDFSSGKHIRITANGSQIKVLLNNDIFIQIDNAYNKKNKILFQSTFKADNAFIKNLTLVKYSDEAANAKVEVVEEKIEYNSAEMKSLSDILKIFEKIGWKCTETSAISTDASSAKGVNIGGMKNFILDYTVKFDKDEAGSAMMKFRHYYNKANYGYILNFSARRITFTRYKEQNNGSQDNLGMAKVDLTDGAKVRVVAYEGLVWIAVNGEKIFEITDAKLYSGQIQFLHECSAGGITFGDFSLKSYEEEASYEGMTSRSLKDLGPKIYKDFDIRSQAEAQKAFYGKMDYIYKDGRHALGFSSEGKNKELHIANDIKNFVMEFELNLDEAANTNKFIINIRKNNFSNGDGTGYSTGYQLCIGQKNITLAAYTGKSYRIGDVFNKVAAKVSGWTPVKVVVVDDRLCVFVNGQLVMKQEGLEYTNMGFISIQNNLSSLKQIYIANVSLTDYYEGAIPDDSKLVNLNSQVQGDDKAVLRPVKIPAFKGKSDTADNQKGNLNTTVIIVIAVCAILVIIGAAVTVTLIILKRRKKSNKI